jgi:uncharacterized membrane protein (UPF0127 family)
MPCLRRFDRCELVRLELPSGATVQLHVAETFAARLLGLAGLAEPSEHGILIPRCRSVHTLGMRFPIDIVFLAWPPSGRGEVRVLTIHERIPPGRVTRLRGGLANGRRCVAAAELRGGKAEELGVCDGMQLRLDPAGVDASSWNA